jgi:hypothetical protein
VVYRYYIGAVVGLQPRNVHLLTNPVPTTATWRGVSAIATSSRLVTQCPCQ